MRKIFLTAIILVTVISAPLLFAEQITLKAVMPAQGNQRIYYSFSGAQNIEATQYSVFPWETYSLPYTPAWSAFGLTVPVRTGDIIRVSVSANVLNAGFDGSSYTRGGGDVFLWPNEGAARVVSIGGPPYEAPIRRIGYNTFEIDASHSPRFWSSLHMAWLWEAVADGSVTFRLGLHRAIYNGRWEFPWYDSSSGTSTYIRVLGVFMWAERAAITNGKV